MRKKQNRFGPGRYYTVPADDFAPGFLHFCCPPLAFVLSTGGGFNINAKKTRCCKKNASGTIFD
jgi:hypothetical protein